MTRIACRSFAWALLLALLGLQATPLAAQPRGNRLMPRYVTVGPPDQAEGARVLEEFRQLGVAGDYYLDFVLEVLPRRGARWQVPGRLWGSRDENGPVSRLAITPAAPAPVQRWLVRSGPAAAAWRSAEGAAVSPVSPGELLAPLAGTTATLFDLQMPFVQWRDFVFEGVAKIRGRTAHAFLLYPRAEFASAYPSIGGVRIYLDMQFHALMQAVVLDTAEQPWRTMTVIDLKKVGEQWIPKSIDFRDERTRDKTRFRVTGAALNAEFSSALFRSDSLRDTIAPPPGVVRID
ncbi:MAG TPA: outer membrane lipoprotein-sorting protein [Candidatus Synoicihabitans sp.]|nr:outer membrane lipoprotein-sorting protein [Candidatus Synoicihabitans sp.]